MRLGEWINRKRHNRGFGIQSPSSFFFITQVLKERLPYYAYPILDRAVGGSIRKRRHFRELFRITNHLQPANCISIGSAEAACAMILAKPGATHYAILPAGATRAQTMLSENGCNITTSVEELPGIISNTGTVGMLYIKANKDIDTLVQAALQHTNNDSTIVVDGINRNKASREWWRQIVKDNRTIVTYDMYSYGLLFFDKERKKQHYTLKR